MNYISETDIRNIVQKVMAQTASPSQSAAAQPADSPCASGKKRTIAVGSDHGGYDLKTTVIAYLQEMGHTVIDCGTHSKESVDYPDFAFAVADKVRQGIACRGIVIDAAGIGSCMAANKVPGVRAAMCVDYATASNSREHNNANVLSLGAGLLGVNQVKLIIKTFLETDFGGGRHARRVDKITDIENKFLKDG
ncbi:MAG: ribose 5-phosphate isomerase [Chloroflexota bacterium]|nr:ribose 5-phosphate isomerase [Chloroflexota bacterium]